MKSEEYIEGAKTTEPTYDHYVHSYERLDDLDSMRLLHAAIGLATEAGEFLDAVKKFIFYGKPLDKVNLIEELGDSFWYAAIACEVTDTNFEQVMERNLNKLRARYPDRFSEKSAQNRDLALERKKLERD